MSEPVPVACTLTTKDAAAQVVEWSELRRDLLGVERIDGGVEMRFPSSSADAVRYLAAREATCCAFLSLLTTDRDDEVELRITSDAPEASGVIELLAGLDSGV